MITPIPPRSFYHLSLFRYSFCSILNTFPFVRSPFFYRLSLFQYYFINALFAIGMVLGLMGLTIFLRWEYSLFGDPIGPLIFAIIFLFGDLVQKLLRQLAGIKVRRKRLKKKRIRAPPSSSLVFFLLIPHLIFPNSMTRNVRRKLLTKRCRENYRFGS